MHEELPVVKEVAGDYPTRIGAGEDRYLHSVWNAGYRSV